MSTARVVQPLALVVLLAAVVAPRVEAQVFQLSGGGSSLYEGFGGTLNIWGNGYEGQIGVGYLNGLRLNLFARKMLGRDTLHLGNDVIPLDLATDLFGSGNAALVQGASIHRVRGRTRLSIFGGASAIADAAPFFSTLRADRAMVHAFLEQQITPRLTWSAHTVATNRQTILQSLDWRAARGVTAGVTGGVGDNAPYGAATLAIRNPQWDVKAGYYLVGDGFRRAAVPLPMQTEVEGENVVVTWRPRSDIAVGAGRQHFVQDSVIPGVADRATLNQIFGNARIGGFTLATGLFDSEAGGDRSYSSYLQAGRRLTPWLQSDLYLLRVWAPAAIEATTPVLYLRETVSSRLALVQVITHERGRTAVSFGGALTTGLTTVGVDYQLVQTPFRPADPFSQSLSLNVRLQLGDYQLSAASFLTPDGRVNYTASGSTFFYHGLDAGPQSSRTRFEHYLVAGEVVDESGAPVEGAAIDIGGQIVYSDSRGRFFVRQAGARLTPLRVVLDDFLLPGYFELVDAPAQVTATREDHPGAPIRIVVRRVAPQGGAPPAPPLRNIGQ